MTDTPDLSNGSTDQQLFIAVSRVFEPLVEAGEAAANGEYEPLERLLESVGVPADNLEDTFDVIAANAEAVAATWETIDQVVEGGELPPVSELRSLFDDVRAAVVSVRDLDNVTVPEIDGADVGSRLLDYLLLTYLRRYHASVYNGLAMVGVVIEGAPGTVDFTALPDVLEDPNSVVADLVAWGSDDFDVYVLLYYLREILWNLGIPASLSESNPAVAALASVSEGDDEFPIAVEQELRIPIVHEVTETGGVALSLALVPLPPTNDGLLPGVAVVPLGNASLNETIPLTDTVTFDAGFSAEQANWGLTIRPDAEDGIRAELESIGDGEAPTTVHGEAGVTIDSHEDETKRTLIGDSDGNRLAIGQVSVRASIRYDGDELSMAFETPTTGSIVLQPDAFDGFLANVLPGDGIDHDFDVTVGWSSSEGLYFERGGTLETSIPQNASIGPVTFEEIHLAVRPDADDGSGAEIDEDSRTIRLTGAASATVELGPATGTITRMGMDATLSFPEDAPFPPDLDVGFKPPDGIGLAIDSGPVSGGGFLEFDHENNRYAGAVQLHVGDLTLNAVGLLTTELPDGGDGFSLLVIVAGEFTPVQLGFGFTLNGVGGLVGIHRSMKKKPLQEAVASGSLDSVLFPEDPVANAQRIITDLRAIFPPTRDTHVFGPMVRLGWGTPTLITADLGVVLEVPSLNIAILGRLSALLPDDVAPLIELNMDVLGFVDQEAQEVSIDASLFDSRVLQWSLSGDFALRSGWGQNPRFILSAGGFHPEYEPPGTFPELDRVKASMGKPDDRIYVELSGYFALTTNTAQVGGKVDAAATAGSLEAAGTIWFDALFEFDPFFFTITFGVKFSVTYKGKGFSLTAKGKLEGPSPWYVEGRVEIDLKLKTIGKSFSGSIGSESDDDGLPPADVMSKLLEELERPGNWSAQRPADAGSLVTVRELDELTAPSTGPDADDDAAERVLVHPLGTISVRQTVVPLDFRIEVFGNARPATETKFTIEGAAAEGEADALELEGVLEEQFAPGQYLDLTEEEKLDSPSFESLPAGRTVESAGVFRGGDSAEERLRNAREATLCYETFVEDRRKGHWATPLADLGRFKQLPDAESYLTEPVRLAQAFDDVGAVATAKSRAVGKRKYVSPVVTAEATTVDAEAEPMTATVDVDAETDTLTVTAGPVVESGDVGSGDAVVDGPGDGDAGSGRLEFDERSISQTGEVSFESVTGGSTLSVEEGRYVPVDSADMTPAPFAEGPVSKTAARRAIARHVRANPAEKGRYQVVERRRVRATTEGIR
ncbi:DUF6603 domain-containing protein [Natronobeatus ordinarius]|uniref:DUF6603 domain-containing protein n=1 Tax=Natronobeatus ordinarius TaxID=2963433 RepID=UPI0020CBA541|nr:DUF6603 domain-containing protein [Natronobeatus ordinarius]